MLDKICRISLIRSDPWRARPISRVVVYQVGYACSRHHWLQIWVPRGERLSSRAAKVRTLEGYGDTPCSSFFDDVHFRPPPIIFKSTGNTYCHVCRLEVVTYFVSDATALQYKYCKYCTLHAVVGVFLLRKGYETPQNVTDKAGYMNEATFLRFSENTSLYNSKIVFLFLVRF